jgi:hypothetical protein
MEMIRKAAAKFNTKVNRNHRVRRTETSSMDKYGDGNNINAWTDPEKYVDEHYGDRARAQSSYESEWN